MRIATFRSGGRRRVGSLSPDGKTIRPFDLGAEAEERGALSVIERGLRADSPASAPRSPPPASSSTRRSRDPRRNIFCVGKNYHEHAHEFANERLRFQRGLRRRAGIADRLHQGPGMRDRAGGGRSRSTPPPAPPSTTRRSSPSSSAKAGAASRRRRPTSMSGAAPSSMT